MTGNGFGRHDTLVQRRPFFGGASRGVIGAGFGFSTRTCLRVRMGTVMAMAMADGSNGLWMMDGSGFGKTQSYQNMYPLLSRVVSCTRLFSRRVRNHA